MKTTRGQSFKNLCFLPFIAVFLLIITINSIQANTVPEKIISLAPSITEILYSLGLEKNIIAVTSNCNYPAVAKSKSKIGDINLNYEKIVALKPDLVIGEATIFKEAQHKLKKLNVPLLMVKSSNLKEFKKSFLVIGKVAGKENLAKKLILDLETEISKIQKKTRAIPLEKKPKVFVEIWNQPIITAGPDSFIGEIIKIAGGHNIVCDLKETKSSFPTLSPEIILKANPDVIILTTSTPEEIYKIKSWRNIKAVKNKRVYKINPDIIARPTLRITEAVKFLFHKFYQRET